MVALCGLGRTGTRSRTETPAVHLSGTRDQHPAMMAAVTPCAIRFDTYNLRELPGRTKERERVEGEGDKREEKWGELREQGEGK